MKKIKILFLSHFFYPQNIVSAIRATKLIKYFPKSLDITIFTANAEKNGKFYFNQHEVISSKCKMLNIESNIPAKKKHLTLGSSVKLILRDVLFIPDKYIWWYLFKIPSIIRLIKIQKIDIIIATGSPFSTFVITYIFKKIFKLPYILDFRDPWVESTSCNIQSPYRLFFIKLLERLCVQNADGIVSTSKSIQDKINHIKSDAIKSVIYNGFDKSYFSEKKESPQSKNFIFMYTGKYSIYRPDYNPKTVILSFIKFIKDNYIKDSELYFIGKTDEETIKWITSRNCIKIKILPFIPQKKLIEFQTRADSFISFCYPIIHKETILMKLFEYAMQKKPIISFNCNEGEIYDFLKKNGIGFSVSNSNIEEMAEAYYKVYSGEFQIKEDSIDLGKYDYKYLSQKFANIITKVLDKNKKFINNLE